MEDSCIRILLCSDGSYGTEQNSYRLRPHNGVGIMKYLCLAFVIGWSGAAYAASGTSPSVNVPITISGVCNNPAVPHPAQVAGFTTLAYCADFTQQNATNNVVNGVSQTMVWTTLANWLDCAGASKSLAQWSLNGSNGKTNTCSGISVANDATAGSNVLKITQTPADGGAAIESIATVANGGVNYELFPGTNSYAEVKYRLNTADENNIPASGQGNVVFDWWSMFYNGGLEIDFIETWGGAPGTWSPSGGFLDWNNSSNRPSSGGGNYIAPTFDSNYHTFGSLMTSNGSSGAVGQCSYADGVAAMTTCHYIIPSEASEYTQSNYLLLWNGAAQAATLTGNVVVYIEWIRVWSCAGWLTGSLSSPSNSCSVSSPYTGTPP
jgi:hypothetical protein